MHHPSGCSDGDGDERGERAKIRQQRSTVCDSEDERGPRTLLARQCGFALNWVTGEQTHT
ncbi:hypothetical protein EYF80_008167 [Liparis tanakae]|uniref:Uncharacterized protein n=1 Tax=Liparis tanakae TaxID=230148 RepID=A0A4Z2IV67_9TELE|nr:hypothetical protein EYF80_008167 [Liparis tanakae]